MCVCVRERECVYIMCGTVCWSLVDAVHLIVEAGSL